MAGWGHGEAKGGAEEEEKCVGAAGAVEAGVGDEEEGVSVGIGEGEVAGNGGESVRREEAADGKAYVPVGKEKEVGEGMIRWREDGR